MAYSKQPNATERESPEIDAHAYRLQDDRQHWGAAGEEWTVQYPHSLRPWACHTFLCSLEIIHRGVPGPGDVGWDFPVAVRCELWVWSPVPLVLHELIKLDAEFQTHFPGWVFFIFSKGFLGPQMVFLSTLWHIWLLKPPLGAVGPARNVIEHSLGHEGCKECESKKVSSERQRVRWAGCGGGDDSFWLQRERGER